MEPLSFGNYYHIYNRGIAKANLFYKNGNYEHFLNLYKKYIDPIADTYAYCLMPNHFHLLVRIKEEEEINDISDSVLNELSNMSAFAESDSVQSGIPFLNADRSDDTVRLRKLNPARQFSHLFNAHAKYINAIENRTGSLFQRPFKRKKIETEAYLKQLVIYIHANPVKHGFAKYCKDYYWSSYQDIISSEPTNIKREQVLNWFNSVSDFIKIRNTKSEMLMDEKIVFE